MSQTPATGHCLLGIIRGVASLVWLLFEHGHSVFVQQPESLLDVAWPTCEIFGMHARHVKLGYANSALAAGMISNSGEHEWKTDINPKPLLVFSSCHFPFFAIHLLFCLI